MIKRFTVHGVVALGLVVGCSDSEQAKTAQTAPTNPPDTSSIEAKSSEPSDAAAQCLLGMRYRGGIDVQQDDVAAAKWFLKAAEQGDATAQFYLGVICLDGSGVPQDQGAGFRWSKLAAEQGEPRAQYNLAVCYFKGEGVTQDVAEAAKWFQRAAEQGHAQAQGNLGCLFADGIGVSKDLTQAFKWFKKAAEAGVSEAAHNVGICLWRGEGVDKSPSEAMRWYRQAAERGIAASQLAVAAGLHGGLGVPVDIAEAAKWYRLAAQSGVALAQVALGGFCSNGQGVPKDDAEAAKWFTKAAEQGDVTGQYNLARCYRFGLGVLQDDAAAARWYRRAAEQGYGPAQVAMSILQTEGTGVAQDTVSAYAWANLAAASGAPKAREMRDFLVENMTRDEISDGQKLAREFRPRSESAGDAPSMQPPSVSISVTGSGFFISQDGAFVTNHHVVVDARRISIQLSDGKYSAKVLRADPINDLAVLQVDLSSNSRPALPICGSRVLRLSDRVATLGFPNPGLQGLTAKYSGGEVAALSGPNDDPRFIQVSTPIQPGNSGGPLFDSGGCVVGVVVAQLDKLATFERTGSFPENVNYAIKGSILLALVESVPGLVERLQPARADSGDTQLVPGLVEPACGLVLVER